MSWRSDSGVDGEVASLLDAVCFEVERVTILPLGVRMDTHAMHPGNTVGVAKHCDVESFEQLNLVEQLNNHTRGNYF